jgi:hypothetical protein
VEPNAGQKILHQCFSGLSLPWNGVYMPPAAAGEGCDFLKKDTVPNIPAPDTTEFQSPETVGNRDSRPKLPGSFLRIGTPAGFFPVI